MVCSLWAECVVGRQYKLKYDWGIYSGILVYREIYPASEIMIQLLRLSKKLCQWPFKVAVLMT